MFESLRKRIENIRWEDAAELSWWVKLVRSQVGLYFYIVRELIRDRCLQQAAALTFTTLLSLVPLLAVAFSLYRSFAGIEGLAGRAEDAIFQFVLASPLIEGAAPEAPGEKIKQKDDSMSPDEMLSEAQRLAGDGENAQALHFYVKALDEGADAGAVRRGLSLLRLPPPGTTVSYIRQITEKGLERYQEAAKLPPGHGPPGGDESEGEGAVKAVRKATQLLRDGSFAKGLALMRVAESGGYPPIESRQIIAASARELANQKKQDGELEQAASYYREALAAGCDTIVLTALQGGDKEVAQAHQRHQETCEELGEALLRLGKEKANFYNFLEDRGGAEADRVMQAAIEELEEAATLLQEPTRAHIAAADLMWERSDRRDEAKRYYQAAARAGSGVAAKGISTAAADYIREFIARVGRARIGILATVFLIITATSLVSTIEKTFNHIWKVTKRRAFWARFTSFWTLICLGPVLIGATIWVQEQLGRYVRLTFTGTPVLGGLVSGLMTVGQYALPFVTTWLLLIALYKFLPHTRVKFASAAWGALVGAALLQCARWLFTIYVGHAIKYQVIYGSLGAIPLFLLWVWLLWVIVLFGSEIAFTIQNLGLLRYHEKLRRLSDVFIDRHLAARIMMYVAREFWDTGRPISVSRLAEILQITPEEAADAAGRLVKLGLLTPAGDRGSQFHPARDLSRLKLADVLSITDRFRSEYRSARAEDKLYEEKLEAAFRSAIEAQEQALAGLTFRDFLQRCEDERDKWPTPHSSE
ncbi:MAG: YihY family inner membrane protein [Planctomycetes bacterium]|nr:YihY family inner membrane protein [Planctomycetota bacterium]